MVAKNVSACDITSSQPPGFRNKPTTHQRLSDAELFARTLRGDGAAFECRYRLHLPAIRRLPMPPTGDREIRNELTMEVFTGAAHT